MFDLDNYLNDLILNCRALFGKRLLYVGLQGSYLRGQSYEPGDGPEICPGAQLFPYRHGER